MSSPTKHIDHVPENSSKDLEIKILAILDHIASILASEYTEMRIKNSRKKIQKRIKYRKRKRIRFRKGGKNDYE